tara:strand:+ start:33970 stop:35271 length:1302 start_codon:yes stop_codon:yes gene_type:complete
VQKKIPLVIGYGITGKSLIQYLSENHNELILVEDTADKLNLEEFDELGLNLQVNPVIDDKLLNKVSEIFSSPGIPADHVLFKLASKHQIRISSDIEIFINGNQCLKILVTGTNGKTSTSLILTKLFQSYFPNLNIKTLGNIGEPVLGYIKENLDIAIIEVSSFQLEFLEHVKFDLGILLNISQDHLDRHSDFQKYKQLKYLVLKNASLGISFQSERSFQKNIRNYNDVIFSDELLKSKVFEYWPEHDVQNLKASLATFLAYCENISIDPPNDDEVLPFLERALKDFEKPSHRFEILKVNNGINFINDSKATNFDAMLNAIKATDYLKKDGDIYLICGGDLKNQNLKDSDLQLITKVKKAIIYGKDKLILESSLRKFTNCLLAFDLEDATKIAIKESKVNDYVLFSPACSSLDMFQDYVERGNEFKKLVNNFNK